MISMQMESSRGVQMWNLGMPRTEEYTRCPVPMCESVFRAKRRDVTIRQHLQLFAGRGDDAHRQALHAIPSRRALSPKALSKLTTRRWREKASRTALEKARSERGDEKYAPLFDVAKTSARIASIRAGVRRRLDAIPRPELPQKPEYVPVLGGGIESNLFYVCQVYLNVHWGTGFRDNEYLSAAEYEHDMLNLLHDTFGDDPAKTCTQKLKKLSETLPSFTPSRLTSVVAVFRNDELMTAAMHEFRAWSEEDERRRSEYRIKARTYQKDYEAAMLQRAQWEEARLPEEIDRVVRKEWEHMQFKLEQKLLRDSQYMKEPHCDY